MEAGHIQPENNQAKAYQRLIHNLEELTKHYRQILELVRKEKELLIAADVEKLAENNQAKEDLLYKIKTCDSFREKYAKEYAFTIGADSTQPRLLELAQTVGGAEGDRLRTIHAMLQLLVSRVQTLNKENEEFAQSALSKLGGALDEIKGTLSGKKTYGQKGQIAHGPDKAGNFVSKEV
jgi:flagellar biosynthesis/type III secretory pathway chaperone